MNRSPGLGGTIAFALAGGAALIALLPAGLGHTVRHGWREKDCAERLRTLHRLSAIRVYQFGPRRSRHFTGTSHWLAIQQAQLIDPSNLTLFFCPYGDAEVTAGETDYRGPRERRVPGTDERPVGGDFEGNHPPCCPLNILINDGTVKSCASQDPWKVALREELRP